MSNSKSESCNDSDLEVFEEKSFSCDKFLIKIFTLITCIKVLLIPTYHSTDFEVHRNWLAITNSLKIDEWYTSSKSQWTLDYPPFFAWFEYALSKAAVFFDPEMLKDDNFDYASTNTKFFQRLTVMIADLFFVYGVKEVGQVFCKSNKSFVALTLLSLCNIGLLVVDHIHFQYNGFLLGVLLISIAKVSRVSSDISVLQGAMWFSILLNLKHLYLYVAPAYGVWLLRSYCLKGDKFISRFLKLGAIVIFVFCLAFGPFVHQIPQVLSRLFPFKRGLVHSYWAANAWALYAGVDKILSVIWKKAGWLDNIKVASMTGGLVQEESFTVLPTPTPLVTFLITFVMMVPALCVLFFKKEKHSNSKNFVRCVVICGLTSFMFSWHVHEKAILTAIIPLCVLSTIDINDARIFILLSSAGHAALFPLLHPVYLTPLKLFLWFAYFLGSLILFKNNFSGKTLHILEWLYLALIPGMTIYESVLHRVIFGDKLPFLPLALTSVYCAIGVSYSYIIYYCKYVFEDNAPIQNQRRKSTENSTKCELEKDA
ncbi:probable dolichyl pyrophosphate Glc1Man9GlcNAc2 alpha-1,3-glucosyltransferase [Copidosoma floridanum]|uniref:probable dolichyl pyrophosphate Glc1Man9GlcNAc2 alpha-1,3-glucosyltransferase n=1 Tax=Copidosoma floridanum TaxID=29053 RepID=UPI0006C9B656|nr:probable dolichyl pyrophosphate Glc1Man9GlcNAc2 alpha-1,3-glucosyltransferase [Copidosoma floridanum]